MAVANNTEDGCIILSGQGVRINTESFIYDKIAYDGISIHYSGGDYCDEKRSYDLTLNVVCDPNAEEIANIIVNESHKCFKIVTLNHKTGCKIGQLSGLWEWSKNHEIVIAVPCILIGFFTCFTGITLLPILYISSGIVFTVSAIWLIFYSTFLQNNTQDWVGWLVMVGSTLLGCLIGFFFYKV
jgi:hypothetical protein